MKIGDKTEWTIDDFKRGAEQDRERKSGPAEAEASLPVKDVAASYAASLLDAAARGEASK